MQDFFLYFDETVIGANLRRLRIANGYTIEDVQAYFGHSYQTIWKWETGRALPKPDKLLALMLLYHAEVQDLIHNIEEGQEPSSAIIWINFLFA